MASPEITLEAVPSASDINAADWDACANPKPNPNSLENLDTLAAIGPQSESCKSAYNPFVSHAFFSAAEASGSACARTGWGPRHLLARLDGEIAGIVPCYLKSHSQGEYVFDRGWADAYERAGGRYYPKLQASVPFTPATGPRLLIRGGVDRDRIGCAGKRLMALQPTPPPRDWPSRGRAKFWGASCNVTTSSSTGTMPATAPTSPPPLTEFAPPQGDQRERREATAAGITIHHLTGSDITEDAWDAFFAFYMETGSRKWGRPYLTRKFFSLIGESMSRDVLLVMAKRNGRWIAGAINFIGSDTLFGRNWGAIEHHPFLHFEVCYYQAIDFAIQRGLKVVEAGAQGEHKLARGYLPQTTYSAHFIADPDLRRAIADYLKRERAYVAGRPRADRGRPVPQGRRRGLTCPASDVRLRPNPEGRSHARL
jgi:predicted N-acyltransferase